ncbi:MAG: hypothetical protein JOY97_00175 [Hyphomicrobiales bacterium]|nr:hypothetical protein [Hyphomicrobiales bacterium]
MSGKGIDESGQGDLNAGKKITLTVDFSAPVTVKGSPSLLLNDGGKASYVGGSNSNVLKFTYTVAPGENTPDLIVSSLDLTGASILDASLNNADISLATNYNPPGILQIDTTAPTIAIDTIARNNVVTASSANAGFSISGTTSQAEDGQTVSVAILDSAHQVVDAYTTTDQSNAWSVPVTSSQATALSDGSYTVTADVSDLAGDPAPTASQAITVDRSVTSGESSEAPSLTLANTSLSVSPNDSTALGITATSSDEDDAISVQISGVPRYETITAPDEDSVSRTLQGSTYTYTITSDEGDKITGLTLTSHYDGSGNPVANLTVTASNTTSGETGTSSAKSISVSDPPASTSTGPRSIQHAAALFTQFAAGFDDQDKTGSGQVTSSFTPRDWDGRSHLSTPHH